MASNDVQFPRVYYPLINAICDYLGRDNPTNRSDRYKSLEIFISNPDLEPLVIRPSYRSIVKRVCAWLDLDSPTKETIQYKTLFSLTSVNFDGIAYFLSSSQEEVLTPFAFLGFYPLPRSFVQTIIDESDFIYNGYALVDFLSFLGVYNSCHKSLVYREVNLWNLTYHDRYDDILNLPHKRAIARKQKFKADIITALNSGYRATCIDRLADYFA